MMSVENLSPKQLVPKLADAGVYLASESTMYRLRRKFGSKKLTRSHARSHVTRAVTVHRASGSNQVWSWDITYLPGSIRGQYFYLYLIMDVWSRRVVGWRVYERESADNAAELFRSTCDAEDIDPRGLVLHSDNGKPMRGATMVSTLQWLGVVPSFSRPHVSNDNPYSEALFRTLKHTPAYPALPFAELHEATAWVERFVCWYNHEHRHSGIQYVTPHQRHFGEDIALLAARARVYAAARRRHPTRWSRQQRNWSPIHAVTLDPQAGLRGKQQTEEASATMA